jgi:hypothetical protein
MAKKETGRKFSCIHCGEPYEAYPPDGFHLLASLKQEDVNDPIKMTFICRAKGCGKENIIYWGKIRPIVLRG